MAERTRGYAHRVDIAADANRVWAALTEEASVGRWCSPGARVSAKSGGMFRGRVDRVTDLEAHIDVFEPRRRLRLIHLPSPAWPASDTAIVEDLMLESVPGGTIVRLLGSGIPPTAEWDTPYKRLRLGWERALARLKLYVEREGNST